MQAYILLDRSGSMQSLWVEALSSVNAFAKELANKTDGPSVDSHVTLAVFDSQESLQFDTLRRKQPALHWENVTDKAVIVVMTDGQENASREVTREGVKAALDRVRAKGWEVVFLGANFDNIADASSVGVGGGKQMAMSVGTMNESMSRLARKSRAYAQSAPGAAPIEFDAEDRIAAKEANIKNKS